MIFSLLPSSAVYKVSGASSSLVAVTMAVGEWWMITTDAAVMVAQGSGTPVASKGNGSTLVNPGQNLVVDGRNGSTLAVIQVAAAANITVTKIMGAR